MLTQAALANKVYLIGGSFPEQDGPKLYNTSLSFAPDGKLLGKHRKVRAPSVAAFPSANSLAAPFI